MVLSWLAVLREPVSLQELLAVQVAQLSPAQAFEAVDGLRRRSLVERGQRPGSFTLHSVVLEFVTGRLVEEASQEIVQGRLSLLIRYGLCQAQAKTYVRETQERLLLTPLLSRLENRYRGRAEVEGRVRELLATLRGQDAAAQGDGPANLAALLRRLSGDLPGPDPSHLPPRRAYFHRAQIQDP